MTTHLARQRRGVGADGDRDRRLVHGNPGQGNGIRGSGQRVADHDLGQAGDGDDIAGDGSVGWFAFHAFGGQQFGDLGSGDGLLTIHLTDPRNLLAFADAAVVDADQRQPTQKGRRVQVGDQRLQRCVRLSFRRRHMLFEHLEQRIQVGAVGNLAVGRRRGARHPGAPGCVQRRQAQRVFGRCGRFVVKVGRDI